jgi:VWFA-related protein
VHRAPSSLLSLASASALLCALAVAPHGLAAAAGASAGVSPAPAVSSPTSAVPPGAFEVWRAVQEHYRGLAAYRDHGVLEVTRPGEAPLRFSFTTAAGPGGAFHFELVPDGAAPGAARRLWRTAGGEEAGTAFLYDAGRGEYAPADPVAALARLGDPGGLDALLVPALLVGAGGSLPRPAGAVVEGAEPCSEAGSGVGSATREADARDPVPAVICHRLRLALPAGELSLWVEVGEPAVWRAELRRSEGRDAVAEAAVAAGLVTRGAGAAHGASVVRVWHRPEPAADAAPPRAAELAPPAGAVEVAELPVPPTAPAPAATARLGGETPAATFGDVVNVRLATFVVRVLDGDGEPVRGLGPEDFVVSLGEERVPVAAVDWVSSAYPEAPEEGPGEAAAGLPAAAPRELAGPERAAAVPGKLVVLFVQADFNALRIHGHLKFLPFVRDLLDSLAPADRVALVSFDSHLKLWHDFTTDREAVHDAVYRAVRFGNDPPQLRDSERRHRGPSLAARLDPAAAKDAPWAEKGLELVAEALAPLPGEKAIVFLGWGLGRWGFGGFRPRHGYWQPAVDALTRANATVFVLDVADAAYHTLEIGLRQIAAATGGTYDKTAVFPVQATKRLARLLGGHYLLTVDADALVAGDLDVQLVDLPRGARVLMRPLRVETATRP